MMRWTVPMSLGLAVVALQWTGIPAQAADAVKPKHLVGQIVRVSPTEQTVVIRPRQGAELTFLVDKGSQLQLGQHDVALKDFTEGMRVRVVYETTDKGNRVIALTDPLLTREKVAQAISDAFEIAKKFTYQQKDQYERKLQPVLDDIDQRIDELSERAAEATPEARAQIEKDLAQVRRQREILQDKLSKIEASTPEAWNDIRSAVHNAIDDVQQGIDHARAHINNK